ncbi:hypothetical protein Y032_0059g3064 [Ancylostoma ceylanicum]|uniref:LIM zinc-binding domain-containing protein n=1 Tax=Ancylostoma ceylanicum TaxID=53326 RepID=A0A016U4P1_9BILA|nr:hypothetical protein Y032_0059g3064 [Ancylostoma ceylanicum]
MPNCPSCNKPVYFAERVTSLGKDWHRPCLRCANDSCKKTLSPGSHAENWFADLVLAGSAFMNPSLDDMEIRGASWDTS